MSWELGSSATDWLLLAFGVVLTLGTAIFVASEFTLLALDPVQVDEEVQAGRRGAKGAQKALKSLSTHLSGAQVGITLTTILLGYTSQNALANLLEDLFHAAPFLSHAFATFFALALAVILVNVFSMFFGELLPKNLALSAPWNAVCWALPAARVFTFLFRPLIFILNGISNGIVRLLGVQPVEEAGRVDSAPELAALVQISAQEGALEPAAAKLFERSVALEELTAADVMVPRGAMVSLRADQSAQELIETAAETGFSRFPVLGEGGSDDVLGVANLRKAIRIPYDKRARASVASSSMLSEFKRVPETIGVLSLLKELREEGLQMALVVDEYGGTAGIVTLEDVIEEIVGEVSDEHDSRRRGVRSRGRNEWMLDGTLRPDEVTAQIGVAIPQDGPYETLAGLILMQLERMAKVGDTVQIPGAELTVRALEGHRISKVLLRSVQGPTAGGKQND